MRPSLAGPENVTITYVCQVPLAEPEVSAVVNEDLLDLRHDVLKRVQTVSVIYYNLK